MILYKITSQKGEHTSEWYGYYKNYSKEQYNEGVINDILIVSEFCGYEFETNEQDKDKCWHMSDSDEIVKVDWVKSMTQDQFKTLKQFKIID